MNWFWTVPFLNYAASTAGLYLMLAVPALLVRGVWWYWRFRREVRPPHGEFRVPEGDLASIAEREVSERSLEYWHEPLCWVHIVFGLICIRIAPVPVLVLIYGLSGKGWLTGAEYLQVLFFAGALLFFLLLWVRAARGLQFSVSAEGIAFKPGLQGEVVMAWGNVLEAVVYGARPVAAVVRGMGDDGKEHTVLLCNGFYKPADFETITFKLLGRRSAAVDASSTPLD